MLDRDIEADSFSEIGLTDAFQPEIRSINGRVYEIIASFKCPPLPDNLVDESGTVKTVRLSGVVVTDMRSY